MACSQGFIDFISDTLSPLGEVKSRKMMGDFIIYLNGKCVATACDNNLYVKIIPELMPLMKGVEIGKPYEGAKEHYILDMSNPTLIRDVISYICDVLSEIKRK